MYVLIAAKRQFVFISKMALRQSKSLVLCEAKLSVFESIAPGFHPALFILNFRVSTSHWSTSTKDLLLHFYPLCIPVKKHDTIVIKDVCKTIINVGASVTFLG